MSSPDETIRRFVRYVTLGETPERARVIVPHNDRLPYDLTRRTIFSYGRHFPLGTFVPREGRNRARWIVNGDRWSGGFGTTNRHQESLRSEIASAVVDAREPIDIVTIPFSALDGAGIVRESIRLIHAREDRREVFQYTAKVPADALAVPLPTREQAEFTSRIREFGQGLISDDKPLYGGWSDRERYDSGHWAIHETQTLAQVSIGGFGVSLDDGRSGEPISSRVVELTRSVCYRGHSYGVNPETALNESHWREYDPPKVEIYLDGGNVNVQSVDDDGMATLTFSHDRHWLGDSLFSAVRRDRRTGTERRMRFLSSFDYQESPAMYFLCAVPRGAGDTVDSAVDALAPPAVHAARARGLNVVRQGDIFAVATTLSREQVYDRARARTRLSVVRQGAKPRAGEIGWRRPLAPAQERSMRQWRRDRFRALLRESQAEAMGALDRGATGVDSYMKTRRAAERAILAHSFAMYGDGGAGYSYGVGRDWERLAAIVKEGRPKMRDRGYNSRESSTSQGGRCYSRAIHAWSHACAEARARFLPDDRAIRQEARTVLSVHGTAHSATEVAIGKGGATYLRGIMYHATELEGNGRRAEHRRIPLGDRETWYLAIRNTVPRQ